MGCFELPAVDLAKGVCPLTSCVRRQMTGQDKVNYPSIRNPAESFSDAHRLLYECFAC